MATEMWDERLSPRKKISVAAQISAELHDLSAQTLDLSQRGMRVQLNEPLTVTIKIKNPEGEETRNARLVWLRSADDGAMSCGLHFI